MSSVRARVQFSLSSILVDKSKPQNDQMVS